MPKLEMSSGHAFLLGVMALVVAVLCVTIHVLTENLASRIIMAAIWVLIAIAWMVQAIRSRRMKEEADTPLQEGVDR
jgi:MFS-type transporter involved in bile tolerance (Atg22 family)